MTDIQPYREAVSSIKQAILHSQYRAAKLITGEQLSLYFGIGGYISLHSRKGTWGTGALDRISTLLSKELPGLRGGLYHQPQKYALFFRILVSLHKSSAHG